MKRKRMAFIAAAGLCIAAGAGLPAQAKTFRQSAFDIGSERFAFYPCGFMAGTMESDLYRIEYHKYGYKYDYDKDVLKYNGHKGKLAVLCGPAGIVGSTLSPLTGDFFLEPYIFSEGENLQVLAIDGAFKNAESSKIWINDMLMRIGKESFKGARNLKTLTLPRDLNYLGEESLSDMASLETLYFRNVFPPACEVRLSPALAHTEDWTMLSGDLDPTYVSSTPFGKPSEPMKATIFIPRGSLYFYHSNPIFKHYASNIKEYDPEYAYPYNKKSKNGMGLAVGYGFYTGGVEITSFDDSYPDVNIPFSIDAEDYPGSHETMYWPQTVTGIGYRAFADIKEVKTVTIHDRVLYVKEEGFRGCGAESVTLGTSTLFLGYKAFADMTNLKSFTMTRTAEPYERFYMPWPSDVFEGIADGATLYYDPEDPRFYKQPDVFRFFSKLVPVTSGVSEITAEDSKAPRLARVQATPGGAAIFNLTGEEASCRVFDAAGQCELDMPLSAGETMLSLDPGFHIVIVNDQSFKILVK